MTRTEHALAQHILVVTGHILEGREQPDGRRDLCGVPGWSLTIAGGDSPDELQAAWIRAVRLAAAYGEQPLVLWRDELNRWRCAWATAAHTGGQPSLSFDACLQSDPFAWAVMTVRAAERERVQQLVGA